MRILLIGTGYVGMALTASWKDPNDRFIATTTTESKLEEVQSLKQVERSALLEIKKTTDLRPLIEQCDAVIVTVAPKRGAGYRETYLDTATCLKEAVKNRKEPLYLLYTSSTGVYGNQGGALVDESSKTASDITRAKTLSEVEDLLLSCENSQIQVCVLRLGGIYGPMRSLEKRAERMSKKEMGGSGDEPTNHIHLEDITGAIQFCLTNRLSGVFNLVNEDHPSRRQLYGALCEKLNLAPPVWKAGSPSVTNARVSGEKIKNAGYLFQHPNLTF